MLRGLSSGAVLFGFWLVLSGHYTPFLIGVGLVCAAMSVVATMHLHALDRESHPMELVGATLTYYPWLVLEIVKSAWSVTRIVLHPRLPISPTMTTVEAGQRTPVGIATYANSITLTPGTITTKVRGNRLTVHALVREGASDVEAGGMNARVRRFEGEA